MPLKRFIPAAWPAAWIVAAALVAGVAQAQTSPCAPDDLQCRVTQLEARVDALTAQLQTAQAKPAAAASAPAVAAAAAPAAPTKFYVRRTCSVNCEEEAAAECSKRGFADGSAKDWERPKSGPTVLTRISCRN